MNDPEFICSVGASIQVCVFYSFVFGLVVEVESYRGVARSHFKPKFTLHMVARLYSFDNVT